MGRLKGSKNTTQIKRYPTPKPKIATVPIDLERFVKETPDFITVDAKGHLKRASYKCAEAIKAMPSTQCLVFTLVEFQEMFKTNGKVKGPFQAIRRYMMEAGVNRPKVVEDNGRIFITHVKID